MSDFNIPPNILNDHAKIKKHKKHKFSTTGEKLS